MQGLLAVHLQECTIRNIIAAGIVPSWSILEQLLPDDADVRQCNFYPTTAQSAGVKLLLQASPPLCTRDRHFQAVTKSMCAKG